MNYVLMEKKDGVGYISLNRPEKHNAMNHGMVAEIVEALSLYDKDEEVSCIVLRGEGKSFCSGYDMSPDKKPFTTYDEWRKEAVDSNAMDWGIWDNRKMVIASVKGYCLAGGCDLMLCCDMTISADNAVFSEPELEFSTHPSFLILPYIVPLKVAKYMLVTGERFNAEEAKDLGMVNKIVTLDDLDKETHLLAKKVAKLYSPAMQYLKRSINMTREIAGLRNMIDVSEEYFTASKMQLSPLAKKFFEIAEKDGMKAAIEWRTAYFAESSD